MRPGYLKMSESEESSIKRKRNESTSSSGSESSGSSNGSSSSSSGSSSGDSSLEVDNGLPDKLVNYHEWKSFIISFYFDGDESLNTKRHSNVSNVNQPLNPSQHQFLEKSKETNQPPHKLPRKENQDRLTSSKISELKEKFYQHKSATSNYQQQKQLDKVKGLEKSFNKQQNKVIISPTESVKKADLAIANTQQAGSSNQAGLPYTVLREKMEIKGKPRSDDFSRSNNKLTDEANQQSNINNQEIKTNKPMRSNLPNYRAQSTVGSGGGTSNSSHNNLRPVLAFAKKSTNQPAKQSLDDFNKSSYDTFWKSSSSAKMHYVRNLLDFPGKSYFDKLVRNYSLKEKELIKLKKEKHELTHALRKLEKIMKSGPISNLLNPVDETTDNCETSYNNGNASNKC